MVLLQPASLFYAEEAEVETRQVDEDVSLFQSTCQDIQQVIKDVRKLKDENRNEMPSKVVSRTYNYKYRPYLNLLVKPRIKGAQWLSGRMLDSRPRAAGSSLTGVTALRSLRMAHLS